MFSAMSRVLVTGGAGFIGANLVRKLVEDGTDVRILDDLSAGRLDYLQDLPVDLVRGNILDPTLVRRAARGANAIVHLAALPGVATSAARPRRDFDVNVVGTFNVLDAARARDVPRVVFASSGAVVAGGRPPFHEEVVPSPRSPYGASKLYGEAALQAFGALYRMTGISLRFSNVYGPYCAHKNSVVAAFLRRALRRQPFFVYGSGRQTRDFLFVDDVTAAIKKTLSAGRGGLYQLGTGDQTSVLKLARLIADTCAVPLQIERRPARPGESSRNFVDYSRARAGLGWEPSTSLKDGLAATAAWMRRWPDP
jgi:UDP-glucose 4-epimerase